MSDKENDHNTSDRKEKNLKRHELCCLRFSDGTASDRDAATLQRKGIDPKKNSPMYLVCYRDCTWAHDHSGFNFLI